MERIFSESKNCLIYLSLNYLIGLTIKAPLAINASVKSSDGFLEENRKLLSIMRIPHPHAVVWRGPGELCET